MVPDAILVIRLVVWNALEYKAITVTPVICGIAYNVTAIQK